MVKLFIGNLAETVGKFTSNFVNIFKCLIQGSERLVSIFSQHVPVQEADVLKSYAFVVS